MKITYDPEVDAMSIRFDGSVVESNDELEEGLIVDYDINEVIAKVQNTILMNMNNWQ